ncbi:nitrous oxide reductase family maturation protein NosD [Hoeflea prorocentri]|uniref:Nitrous oxide reductase family maturation protein NosD n=1 Tax=Hoeflea prorocentri TaxID=1922333 RepID=A0A9X3UGG9_9HYPH|nr:nitrous oxide reductase family maturation protein NosD [Hoeflea prorocentri]MCY6380184.1 nitrous oxide reductase family maturation protein NosD [Hoeflea prorocentri]MDA5397984.1 nitrous oxide reductase family maturation protein NosD [Hoeflea prorocentri]
MLRLGLMTALLIWPLACLADERYVPAEPGALETALGEAQDGDILRLAPGTHFASIVIDRPLTLDGDGEASLEGSGTGSVITVSAPDVTIRGLTIKGSGSSHETIDSGVKLDKKAKGAVVEDNRIIENLHGVDIHGAKNARVSGNLIIGRKDHRMNDRGNGVYVWNAPGAVVDGNDVRWGRDGIFVNTSKKNKFTNNRFRNLRFAVHYMYADDSEVSGNISIGNDLGYAVMFSKRVRVVGNISIGDAEHGVMLNYANQSEIRSNLVRDGKNRCVFLYNAHKNIVDGNRFERCAIGIHFTAGSERNAITGNAFIGNRTQVKYVGSRWVDWSAEGRGNHWSDFAAYDINGDGIADAPYRPNDSMDHILWTQPAAKLLLGAPAVQLVRWAQSSFPALLPGGVIDSKPLMRPVEITVPDLGDAS